MSQTSIGLIMFCIIIGMLIVGMGCHAHYFFRVRNHVKRTSPNRIIQVKELMDSLFIYQGPNFNTILILSWILFLIAVAFLFFMTPEVLGGWNYFETQFASDNFGLANFGIAVIIVPGILVGSLVPRAYGYYRIPRNLKQTAILIPILLLAAILCSAYLGTIYPKTNQYYFLLGFVFLTSSLVLMLAPLINGYIEEMRT